MNYYNPNYYTGTGYPYMNNQYMQTQQIQPQMSMPQQQQQSIPQHIPVGLNGKIVDGADMVRATEVPIGSYGIFPKADLSEIYIKSWNPNGTTNIVTFKPIVPETVTPVQEESQGNMVQLFQKIELLESKLDAFIAENKMTGMTSGVMKKEVNASGF